MAKVSGRHGAHLLATGRALTISAWLTGVYFFVELGIGLYTSSIAVISDAFHTFSAVGGILVAMVAARIARRSPSLEKSFGWYRAEILGALINGAFLLVMALVVIAMGAMRLMSPIDLPTGPMLIAAAGGLITEFISIYLLYEQQGRDLNIRGAFWHVLQTFIGSLIIIVAALVIRYTGFLAIDPILGTAFGFVLLWASWGIMRDSMHVLMEGTPPGIDLKEISDALLKINGVVDVHHLHAWALTSNRNVLSAHIRVADEAAMRSAAILEQCHQLLSEVYDFYFSTLQVETTCLDEERASVIDVESRRIRIVSKSVNE